MASGSAFGIAGLGIDFGGSLHGKAPTSQSSDQRPLSALSSLNDFNKDRHGATSSSVQKQSHPAPSDRNRRLSMAVHALDGNVEAYPDSDVESSMSASPRTDASASTTPTSGQGSGSSGHGTSSGKSWQQGKSMTLAKSAVHERPRNELVSCMKRSQSSNTVNSDSSASSSLGRSNAKSSYAVSKRLSMKRLASAPDVNALARGYASDQQVRKIKTKKPIPDGFGGFTDVEVEDEDDEGAGDTTITPEVETERDMNRRGSYSISMSHSQPSFARAVAQRQTVMQSASHDFNSAQPAFAMPRSKSQPATMSSSLEPIQQTQLNASGYCVGSFYNAQGAERARIDENGELLRVNDNDSNVGGSEISGSSASSSSRSSAPRSHFMSSPQVNRAHTGHHASGSEASGASASMMTSSSTGYDLASTLVNMRSERGWRGLSGAERGEAFITMDLRGNSFAQGSLIRPPQGKGEDNESLLMSARPGDQPFERPVRRRQCSAPAISQVLPESQHASSLDRHGTLISANANPLRKSKDLSRLLANGNGKLSDSSSGTAALKGMARTARIGSESYHPPAELEQSRSNKARVDVDLVLESDLVVEGGLLKGRLEIKVRDQRSQSKKLMLTQPKVRIVGFEELLNEDARHIFYHHAAVIDGTSHIGDNASQRYVLHGSPHLSPELDNRQPLACFASQPDAEGYCVAKEGTHAIPFSIELPIGKGARGSFRSKNAAVRYIVIGSVKLKSAKGEKRSIAHFYRHVELYPYLNPAVVLSSAPRPVLAHANKGWFLGGPGKVHLYATLHRHSWVAGQRLYVQLRINNETSKRVKNLTFSLMRDVALFRAHSSTESEQQALQDRADPNACATTVTRKKIAEDVLEVGQRGSKGQVTARGWWTGVAPGEAVDISHNMIIPHDALSMPRGRHIEVAYHLKVSASSSLSSDISVELPVRVINFVSLDPPPIKTSVTSIAPAWKNGTALGPQQVNEGPAIERLRTAGALNVPQPPLRYAMNPPPATRNIGPLAPHGNMVRPTTGEPQDQSRRVQHQKSLDFINHAIRSATARRNGQVSQPVQQNVSHGLGIGVDESQEASSYPSREVARDAIDPQCLPYTHPSSSTHLSLGTSHARREYYEDEEDLGVGHQTLNLNDESVADIDLVIGSARMDGGESSPTFDQRMDFEERKQDRIKPPLAEDFDEDDAHIVSQASQRSSVHHSMHHGFIMDAVDDDNPTPLAHSPPKFQGRQRTQQAIPGSYFPASVDDDGASSSCYTDEESALASREGRPGLKNTPRLVRTESDSDTSLVRGATIIRDPPLQPRPISPSKQAPLPKKSALKTRTHSNDSISEDERSNGSQSHAVQEVPVRRMHLPVPPVLRARVDHSQLARSLPIPQSDPCRVDSRPEKAHRNTVAADSDSEAGSGHYDTSPATSAGLATPPEFAKAGDRFLGNGISDGYCTNVAEEMSGLGIQFSMPKQAASAVQLDSDGNSMPRSSSTHTLRGKTVVVPSVRDKIAHLESRKRALQDFACITSSPGVSRGGTPKPGCPDGQGPSSRLPASRSDLLRNNSTMSDMSSASSVLHPPNYIENVGSLNSLKAPIFR